MTPQSPPGDAGEVGRARLALPRQVVHLGWWRPQWRDHPRPALALRAALAAAIAWAVAVVLPGPAADFPYYAPFGAVVATTFTLAGTARESVQAVSAIGSANRDRGQRGVPSPSPRSCPTRHRYHAHNVGQGAARARRPRRG